MTAIPDAALDDRLGFVGTAGSGKTYSAKGRVERLLSLRHRVVIVDPLDVWFGLRLKTDGKSAAFPIAILGGRHGDLPLNEHSGALIGEAIARSPESCIISLTGLRTSAARERFMLAFLDAIYERTNPDERDPYHVVFDEADLWSPQKPMGSQAMLCHLMEEIVRRGRVKGFIPWVITQRPAVINKNVLSQVDGLVAMKLTSSQDRDAIGSWIEGQADRAQGREILARLPTLQRGHGVVWLPGRGILDVTTFPENTTFDSSRTPKRGEKKRDTALTPLDLGALKDKLASVEQEAKASDPRLLRAEITRLQGELRKAQAAQQAPAPDPAALDAARTQGFGEAVRTLTEPLFPAARQLVAAVTQIGAVAEKIDKTITDVGAQWDQRTKGTKTSPPAVAARSIISVPNDRILPPTAPKSSTPAEGLTGPQQRILDALAELQAIGAHAPPRILVANLAGYGHVNSTGFAKAVSGLKTDGRIEYRGGAIALTDAGRAVASPAPQPLSNDDLHQRIMPFLSGPGRQMLTALIQQYPRDMAREEVMQTAGYQHVNSTGFTKALSRLRSLGFIDYAGPGRVVALPVLFVGGRK